MNSTTTTTAAAAAVANKPIENLEERLESLIETLRQGAIVMEEFRADSGRQVLADTLNSVAAQLSQLGAISEAMQLQQLQQQEEEDHKTPAQQNQQQNSTSEIDPEIPLEVVAHIDKGRNPELFSRGLLESTLAHNQKTHAKLEAIKELHKTLEISLGFAYPDEYLAYKALKSQSLQPSSPSST